MPQRPRKKRYAHLLVTAPKKGKKPKVKIVRSAKPDRLPRPHKTTPEKVIKKVNREAYTFRPTVLLAVGVDVVQGRIVIKETEVVDARVTVSDHFATLHRQIEMAAHTYCIKERLRLGIFRRDCEHPKHRIKKQRYVADETVRNGKVVETIYKHALFCTRCGAKMEDA